MEDGSARRVALIDTVHPGVTHHPAAVAETVAWMLTALEPAPVGPSALAPDDQRYMWKEWAMLLAMLATLASVLPLADLLMAGRFFRGVGQPPVPSPVVSRGGWWGLAVVNALIAGVTYPLFTRLGGLSDLIGARFFGCACRSATALWHGSSSTSSSKWRCSGGGSEPKGAARGRRSAASGWGPASERSAPQSFLPLCCSAGCTRWKAFRSVRLGIEFRFLWPMMRQFSLERFGQFWIYLPAAVVFFALNGGVLLFGQARQKGYSTPARTQAMWWASNSVFALLGLVAVWAVQYVPYRFFGTAPGFEAIGLAQFGELWPLMLFAYIPIFTVLVFMLTWFYRRTGRVYLGALLVGAVATWFTAAGSVLGR